MRTMPSTLTMLWGIHYICKHSFLYIYIYSRTQVYTSIYSFLGGTLLNSTMAEPFLSSSRTTVIPAPGTVYLYHGCTITVPVIITALQSFNTEDYWQFRARKDLQGLRNKRVNKSTQRIQKEKYQKVRPVFHMSKFWPGGNTLPYFLSVLMTMKSM